MESATDKAVISIEALNPDSDSNSDNSVEIILNLGDVNHTMSDSSESDTSKKERPRKKFKKHHVQISANTESESTEDDCKIIAVIPPKKNDGDYYVHSSFDDCPNQMQDKHVAEMYDKALESSETDRDSYHSEEF